MEEIEIDLLGLFKYILRHIFWPLLVAAVFAAGAFAYTKYMVEPTYVASTRIYILNRVNDDMIGYSDLQLSRQLANDYEILITGKNVTGRVIKELGLHCSESALASKLSVSIVSDTRIVQISAVDTDAQMAAKIANCVRVNATEQILNIMGVDAVNLVYEASVPAGPSGPNTKKNAMIGGLIGFVLIVLLLGAKFLLDDTIRDEDDVVRYLQLNTIGVIPATKIAPNKR